MQISNNYGVNSIFNASQSSIQHKKSVITSSKQFDTVSISDEARVAYKNASSNINLMDNAKLEATLTSFFNMWHYGPDFPINKNIEIEKWTGELLPENKAIKDKLEKEVDTLLADHNIEDGPIPQYLRDQWLPLYQKLNAIAALGDSIVLDETTLNNAAYFLQNLENEWSKLVNDDMSLSGQFHSATHSWKNQPQTEEEIREKIEKKRQELADSL